MRLITHAAVTRPKLTLALWLVFILVLAAFGLGVQQRLREGDYVLPGTGSAKATSIDQRGFGTNDMIPVLLEGPPRAVTAAGHRLATDVRARWRALTPWDGGRATALLRPRPDAAILLVGLPYNVHDTWKVKLRPLRRLLDADVRAPVSSHITGNTVGAGATNQAAIEAASTAERIAMPILLLVLLLVFRSPLAAAIPAGIGLATVAASAGIIALLAHLYDIAGTAVTFAAMMGLALGVDYSLLIVSRFREELYSNERVDPRAAAETAALTAGRTVLFAGAVLTVAMSVAVALAPGNVLVSIASGVIIAAALSLVGAMTAVPAALAALGRNVDRWRLGTPRLESPTLTAAARFAMSRPVAVTAAALVVLLAFTVPVLSMNSSPPNFRQMPASYPARQDYEAIRRVVGPGFVTPFEVAVQTRSAAPAGWQAASLALLERRLAAQPGVVAVAGPTPPTRPSAGARAALTMFLSGRSRGGVARIFVVPSGFAASTANMQLKDRLVKVTGSFQAATGMTAAVGGLAGQYVDYERVVFGFIPVLVLVLSALTFGLLAVILRAVVLPAIAVLLNLAIVGAAFGALRLLFQGSHPLLGGPGFVDVVSIAAIFTILFALSVDYAIFLLTRMREAYLAGADPDEAVLRGVGRTASVVTGAALVMTSVFLAFAVSGFVTPRQFGVGLAIAVMLDAIVLRLLLLPAVMRLLGARSWWLPARLERMLGARDAKPRRALPRHRRPHPRPQPAAQLAAASSGGRSSNLRVVGLAVATFVVGLAAQLFGASFLKKAIDATIARLDVG